MSKTVISLFLMTKDITETKNTEIHNCIPN